MIKVYFDGACEPVNPGGTASYGWLIKKDGKTIASGHEVIGVGEGMTNNLAEYRGLIEGLKACKKLNKIGKIIISGDSVMVCNMVSRKWGWKKKKWKPHSKFPHLKKLLDEAHMLLVDVEHEVKWIPREENFEADELSKKHLQKTPSVESGETCGRCSSRLIKRKGKYGEFLGCSKYPKCNFTKNI